MELCDDILRNIGEQVELIRSKKKHQEKMRGVEWDIIRYGGWMGAWRDTGRWCQGWEEPREFPVRGEEEWYDYKEWGDDEEYPDSLCDLDKAHEDHLSHRADMEEYGFDIWDESFLGSDRACPEFRASWL